MVLKQYGELSIPGQGGPSVFLSAAYLGHLELAVKRAQAELAKVSPPGVPALRLFCAEINTLVVQHKDTCNKYEGGPGAVQSLAMAIEELEEMRNVINALPFSTS